MHLAQNYPFINSLRRLVEYVLNPFSPAAASLLSSCQDKLGRITSVIRYIDRNEPPCTLTPPFLLGTTMRFIEDLDNPGPINRTNRLIQHGTVNPPISGSVIVFGH